ncbi:MAG: hypothetical protein JWL77_6675 [Chthonomonadaceae bacterium]|nr:hypothetical protein [Chthonomonadaceae bacterium]
MLRTNKLLSLSSSGLLLAGLAMTASAQTITLGPQTITQATDFTGSFFFTKFNPSLGTLNSVFLTLGTNFTTQLTVTNNSATASSGNATTTVDSALYDPTTTFTTPGNILTPSGGLFNLTDFVNSNPVGYSLAPSASTTLTPPAKTTSLSSAPSFTDPTVLAYFTGGSGTSQIDYRTFTSTNLNNTGGNTSATQTTTNTLSATVVYNYTPASTTTPEPGTWAMMIAGTSTGLVALRRRRNKNKK